MAEPRRIAVIGLGYVGLPVAMAFGRRFAGTVGFDTDVEKVRLLQQGRLPLSDLLPGPGSGGQNAASGGQAAGSAQGQVLWTSDPAELARSDFYILAVPTPIDSERRPDLSAVRGAARTVGGVLARGDIVVLESTVYPGVTEEVVGGILEEVSGLRSGVDFHLGYSPERINPGDPEHSFERVKKIVAAQDEQTLAVLEACFGAVVEAGLHRAASIRVAEAAKVIENVQRDLNIALVNELAMLFDRLEIDTRSVLEAAATKWNFHAFHPGLVGGHCIGVDPYYLTSKAESVGFHPQVILAGRSTNDGMGAFVAAKTIKLLSEKSCLAQGARVAVLGLTFKPDVGDLRNSRVPDVVRELEEYGVQVLLHDPLVTGEAARKEYGLELAAREDLHALDAVLLAVPHRPLIELAHELVEEGASLLLDVLWGIEQTTLPERVRYWRL